MSNQERLVEFATCVPEEYALTAFFLLKQVLHAMEESADEAFCMRLLEDALSDPEKEDLVDFEEACRMAGVTVP